MTTLSMSPRTVLVVLLLASPLVPSCSAPATSSGEGGAVVTSPSAADEAKAATPSSSAGAPSDDVAPAPKTDAPAPKEPAAIDLLTLGAGAVVVSSSPAAEKASLVALDGDDRTTTIGIPRKEPLPHVFVVEMPAATTFERFEVPKIDEFGAAKGRHVKTVRLEGSSTAADQGFSPLLEFELRAGVDAAQGFAVKEPRAIRWLRVTFVDRMEAPPSDVDSARFSDLRGFGSQETIVVPPGTFEGRWRLRRLGINDEPGLNVIELWQRGDELGGCQSLGGQQSTISGSIVDGLARLVAENDKGQRYPSTARVTTAGELVGMSFNGPARVYYAAPDPSAAAPCTPPREPTNAVAQALKDGHVAVLYGIHFDVDQDVLRPSAKPALEQLLAALKATPTLSVVIEGHTDAQGSDAHNLDLSQRRAAAVVQWLTERGIAASQLSAEGRGEAEPIADNETSAGRALNRRVEVEPRPSP